VVSACVVGLLSERGWDRRAWTTALAMVVGNVIIYACGVTWLAQFVGPSQAVALGVLPFIPGDIVKLVLATLAVPAGWRLIGKPS
jgi:biotin transport system substrate-specific component